MTTGRDPVKRRSSWGVVARVAVLLMRWRFVVITLAPCLFLAALGYGWLIRHGADTSNQWDRGFFWFFLGLWCPIWLVMLLKYLDVFSALTSADISLTRVTKALIWPVAGAFAWNELAEGGAHDTALIETALKGRLQKMRGWHKMVTVLSFSYFCMVGATGFIIFLLQALGVLGPY